MTPTGTPVHAPAAITEEAVDRLRGSLTGDRELEVALNAVTTSGVDPSAISRARVVATPTVVSERLDDWKVTAQKKSGRCWLFSSLNLLRAKAREDLGIKDFEFSQNHAMFWDLSLIHI